MDFSRRSFLGTGIGAGIATGALSGVGMAPAFADLGTKMPDWHLGYQNAPPAGFDPSPMKLVFGKVPAGLKGSLYRNGPAQMQYGDTFASHWFDGDGFIHRIAIEDGQAVHTGRFAQTTKHRDEQAAQKFLVPGFGTEGDPTYPMMGPDDANAANTSVIVIDGKLYALWEGGSAYELDADTLDSVGVKSWSDDLSGMPFLAHPKTEPDGRVWNLGVGGPNVVIYRISAKGVLEDYTLVNIGASAYIHDWAMTDRHLIIMVQPWINEKMIPPFIDSFEWRPQDGLKLLIIDKNDTSKRRWAQAPARAFYHTGAAWEESDGTIRLDAALYAEPILGQDGGGPEIRGDWTPEYGSFNSVFTQIVIPTSGDAKLIETDLDGDFPQVDPRFHGKPRKLTALVTGASSVSPGATSLTVYNWETDHADRFNFGDTRMVEEFLFVPKPGGTTEEESWLVGPVLNIKSGKREIVVFDAAGVSDGPLCIWQADYSWPLGFHGTWA